MPNKVYFMGGEPEDFPNGNPGIDLTGNSDLTWTTRGNGGVASANNGTQIVSELFGEDLTTLWFSGNLYGGPGEYAAKNVAAFGVGKYAGSAICPKGVFIGNGDDARHFAVWSYNGATVTKLAEANVNYSTWNDLFHLSISDYGTDHCRIKLYVAKVLVIDWTGNPDCGGIAGFDCIVNQRGGLNMPLSECIVANFSTLAVRVETVYPTGAGSLNEFDSGSYLDVDEGISSETDFCAVAMPDKSIRFALPNAPAGNYVPLALKITANAKMTAGSLATGIKLGWYDGVSEDLGAAQALDVVPKGFTRMVQTVNGNPLTLAGTNAVEAVIRSA